MHARRFLLGTTAAAVTLAAAGALGVSAPTARPIAPSSVAVQANQLAPAAPFAGGLAPLQEYQTPGGGWFYTLNPGHENQGELAGFARKPAIGKLHPGPVSGGVAIHRLRARNGGAPSYMLARGDSPELRNPGFADEGVLGYADGVRKPGELPLLRWSNHGKWRALADGAANNNGMEAAGYTRDGQLGYYYP
jgi:hypothetical protein